MQYAPHALLNCVAWFSLLAYGNAARGVVPSEVLSHFAHTVGTVLVPTLANEIHGARANRSATHKPQPTTETAQRRQLDTRQVSRQDSGPASPGNVDPGSIGNPNGFNFPGVQQAFGPYQYERTYQYRYPGFNQQVQQGFFPGGGAAFNGLPIDPRFFQQQLQGVGNPGLAPIQGDVPKPLSSNINANGNNNLKDSANAIQNLDTNGDSKSSAQNRPFDGQDFSTIPVSPNQAGPGLDPSNGNLRVNNRFAAIDYERVRQNYYSDPPINQQRDYFSFNEIPFSSGAGSPPFRSPLSERYSNLNYNNAGGQPGPSSELRSGNGLGDPYFGSFLQGPYQSLGYNSLPGSGSGSSGAPGFSEDFERAGGQSNFRSPFGGGLQYPEGFNGAFFPGTTGAGFGGADSPLRASASKDSLSQTSRNTAQEERENEAEDRERVDREQKVRYVNGKRNEEEKEGSTTSRA